MPFKIAYDGLAKITTFFITRPRSATASSSSIPLPTTRLEGNAELKEGEGEGEGPREAAFRGRLLLSTPIALPPTYVGLVYTASVPRASIVVASDNERGKGKGKGKGRAIDLEEERIVKRVKVSNGAGNGGGKELMNFPDGRRRSPRKKKPVVVQKYSMDSDEEVELINEEEEEEIEVESEVKIIITDEQDEEMETQEGEKNEDVVILTEDEIKLDVVVDERPSTPPPSSSLPILPASSAPLTFDTSPSSTHNDVLSNKEEEMTALERDIQYLTPISTFNHLQIWNPDIELDKEEDVYARTLGEWVGIAEMVRFVCFFCG